MVLTRSGNIAPTRALAFAIGLATMQSVATAQVVSVINIVPQSRSDETGTDSEPNLAVNPSNVQQMAASAFTPDPAGGANAPIYISTNGGTTWALNSIVPGNNAGFGTGDITLRFGSTSGVLYAGILRGDAPLRLNILRTADFTSAATMTVLVDRVPDDQPYAQALSVLAGGTSVDRVYVGSNNISLRGTTGRTASVDLSQDAATAAAPAGFTTTSVEVRATAALPPPPPGRSQDGPSVRTAIHSSGVAYAAYFGWRTFGTGAVLVNTSDVVVVRDDNFGAGATPFTALTDPGDGLAGVRVVTGVQIPSLNRRLGDQRIGSSLSIAVDPNNSQRAHLAWADGATAAGYTLHVRVSTDGGQNWGTDIRTITPATNPSLAVSSEGKLGFLYQQFIPAAGGGAGTWETHLELTTDDFATAPGDILLHRAPDNVGGPGGAGPLGDYNHLLSVGTAFNGIFSANNTPDAANFPNGVTYQRRADFTTRTLLGNDGVTAVDASIDPFFFSVRNAFVNPCLRSPLACDTVRDPPLGRELIKLKCPLSGSLRECVVFDSLPRNCLVKFRCPGCPDPTGLCPPFYGIYLEGLKDAWEVDLLDGKGQPVPHSVHARGRGVVLTFRPSKQNFEPGKIGDYTLAFRLTPKGRRGVEYPIKTTLDVRETPHVAAAGQKPR